GDQARLDAIGGVFLVLVAGTGKIRYQILMRISEFLRASCVGALLFSPAMADDIEKMHEDALRVLREKLGQANNDLPAPALANTAIVKAPALSVDSEMVRQRAEREARIKAEAQERIAERERLQ